ncbi:MAG: acetylxylan esterase [Lentisphaeria bacterium]|jgi:cephalosporin-C deacetylase-like acetyl esterase|nr:acetylxylan esterase [Lentisphaeria bacterium]
MRSHVLARSAAFLLLACVMRADPIPLPNPGFELVDFDLPACWETRTPTDADRRMVREDSVARQGSASAAIHNQRAGRSRWRTGHFRDFALAPGSDAVLTGWIRTDLSEGGAFLTLYSLAADGNVLGQPQSRKLPGKNDWTQVSVSAKIPAGTAYIMPYLELDGVGSAWFDDIALDGTPAEPSRNADNYEFVLNPDDFAARQGFRVVARPKQAVLELPTDVPEGTAEAVFWGETARYSVLVRHLDEFDGVSELALRVNGVEVHRFRFDQTPADGPAKEVSREHRIQNVDIQCRSRISLHGRADAGEYCRVTGLVFRPVGTFQGDLLPADALRLPDSFRVAQTPAERQQIRRNHLPTLNQVQAEASARRAARLDALATPADWRAYQQETRARLDAILGSYGPKCPLNTRTVGRIVHDGYTIEKIIFESHPNYFVTANLYLPANLQGKAPGVVFTCGHAATGKASVLYHECCLGMVLKGCVVLAFDPTGQGERSEYVDPETGADTVVRTCPQHHYAGRPAWLVGRSLAGYRTWDGIRAVDALLERPEVDPDRLAVVGNSGGGQMAFLIAAADERIHVCVAAHPGGPMENTYLTGKNLVDRDLLGLIAPRPCIIIVGEKSGETYHYARYEDMLRFYRGLGNFEDRLKHQLVDGVHDMKQPKREPAYAWLHRWFGVGDPEGKEPPLASETVEALHCTEKGSVRLSLGGETIASLNAKEAARLRPPRPVPPAKQIAPALADLRAKVGLRFGLDTGTERPPVIPVPAGEFSQDGILVRKFWFESEPGVRLPAVLLTTPGTAPDLPAAVVVGNAAKPASTSDPWLPMSLARLGMPVLAVDVRAAGECDPCDGLPPASMRRDEKTRFALEGAAVAHAYGNTTLAARQAFDTVRAIDALHTLLAEPQPRPTILVGEGNGGLWALLAANQDSRVAAVACVRMLGSAIDLTGAEYYEASHYFWVPGLLADADIAELPALCFPRPVLVLDPVTPLLEPMPADAAASRYAWSQAMYTAAGVGSRFRLQTGRQTPDQLAATILAGVR